MSFPGRHVRAPAGGGARFIGGDLRSAVDDDDHFPAYGLAIEIRTDLRHGAADAAGLVVGGNDEAEQHSGLFEPDAAVAVDERRHRAPTIDAAAENL